jgi:hypothetical protein
MIVWGTRVHVVNLGHAEIHLCQTCRQQRRFDLTLIYKRGCLYWLFCFISSKKYRMVCEVCRTGWELRGAKVEPYLAKVHIPFMHRYGLASLAAVLAAVFAMSILAGR